MDETNKKGGGKLRIVSLAPSATSILCAIGAKKALVGVTKWCGDVADVRGLPNLGDCWHMGSVAEIVALKPDLVIGSVPYKQETVEKLLAEPVNFLAMNPRTLADVENDIRLLGRIAGRAAAGERLIRKMRREFSAIEKKAARDIRRTKRRVRVYCEAWPNPRISSPPWVTELVLMAGGEMVVPAGERVSDEQVAAGRPEVIVLAWAATGDKAEPRKTYGVAAWKDLPALRDRRVFVVRDELLNTPGPPLVEGAQELFRVMHGKGKYVTQRARSSEGRRSRRRETIIAEKE
jgi:iron complex transport system substrate-binding protein